MFYSSGRVCWVLTGSIFVKFKSWLDHVFIQDFKRLLLFHGFESQYLTNWLVAEVNCDFVIYVWISLIKYDSFLLIQKVV